MKPLDPESAAPSRAGSPTAVPDLCPVPDVSIVVPIFNEEESLPILHAEILGAMEPSGRSFEVIYIDDCSTDSSLRVLLELKQQDTRIRIIKFRSNSGQTAAMGAGFEHSRGQRVATLDGDLQNDPADIPRMVEMAETGGWDIVAGWRKRREDGFVLRRLPSKAANRMIGLFTGVRIHDTGCTLKIFSGSLVRSLSLYADQHRFLPVMSAGSGARITETVVNHRARQFGESKYGLSRATRVLLDLLSIKLIAQFSQRPLRYFGLISLSFLGMAMFFLMVGFVSLDPDPARGQQSLVDTALGDFTINDWELIVVSIVIIVLMMTVFFAMLGLLGELVVKASGMHRRGILDRILNELH